MLVLLSDDAETSQGAHESAQGGCMRLRRLRERVDVLGSVGQQIRDAELRRDVDDLRGPVPVRQLLQDCLGAPDILVVALAHPALPFPRLKGRPSSPPWPRQIA